MSRLRYVFSLLLVCLSQPTSAQLKNEMNELLESAFQNNEFSGTALIAKDGRIIYQRQIGFSNDRTARPVTAGSRFNICSIGKMFTAAMIMKLVEQGKVTLTDPVEKILPGTRIPNSDKITIHHLLTHTSGLGNYMGHRDFQEIIGSRATIDKLLALGAQMPLVFTKPGERFEYSNTGYIVLGKIIETLEKKKYADALTSMILKPAGMTFTTLPPDLSKPDDFAMGYVNTNGDWYSNEGSVPPPSSDGGAYTTASDFLRFDQYLYSGKFITVASLRKMQTKMARGYFEYGYGTMITAFGEGVGYGHSGGIPGNAAEYRHYSTSNGDYTLILFCNRDRLLRPLFNAAEDLLLAEIN
jgi:CubicO group peptidase (beta-lactamase class C family)